MNPISLILLAIVITAVIALFNMAFKAITNKGINALQNKMAEKQNSLSSHKTENLADRYKD